MQIVYRLGLAKLYTTQCNNRKWTCLVLKTHNKDKWCGAQQQMHEPGTQVSVVFYFCQRSIPSSIYRERNQPVKSVTLNTSTPLWVLIEHFSDLAAIEGYKFEIKLNTNKSTKFWIRNRQHIKEIWAVFFIYIPVLIRRLAADQRRTSQNRTCRQFFHFQNIQSPNKNHLFPAWTSRNPNLETRKRKRIIQYTTKKKKNSDKHAHNLNADTCSLAYHITVEWKIKQILYFILSRRLTVDHTCLKWWSTVKRMELPSCLIWKKKNSSLY